MKAVVVAVVAVMVVGVQANAGKFGRGLMEEFAEGSAQKLSITARNKKIMRMVDPQVSGPRSQLIFNREFSSEIDGLGDLYLFQKQMGKTRTIEKSLTDGTTSDIKAALENAMRAAVREDVTALRIRNLDLAGTELVVRVSPALHGGRIDRVITIDTINMDINMNKQIIEKAKLAENQARLRRIDLVEGDNSIVIKKYKTGTADEQDQLKQISEIITARNNINWLEDLRGRAPRAELLRPKSEGLK